MATVTAPIMTDATGQSIDSKLNSLLGKMDNLAAAFQPNASGIVYSNTTSGLTGDDVQEAIDEMAADVSEIKQSLSDSVTLSLNQASGKVTSIGGNAYRQGKVVFVSIDLTMNAPENNNWIELGTITPAPPKNIRVNQMSDTNMSGAIALRTQIDSTTGKIKIFFGGAASFSINMMYMTS